MHATLTTCLVTFSVLCFEQELPSHLCAQEMRGVQIGEMSLCTTLTEGWP